MKKKSRVHVKICYIKPRLSQESTKLSENRLITEKIHLLIPENHRIKQNSGLCRHTITNVCIENIFL